MLALFYRLEGLNGQDASTFSLELGEEEGLPAAQVIDGLQDKSGFIWVVSGNRGLSRLDANRVRHYESDKYGLPQNIQYILEAQDSMIWVVSYLLGEKKKAIHIFDPLREQALPIRDFFRDSLPFGDEAIDLIQQNDDGTIWLKTLDSRIYEYDGRRLSLWANYAPLRLLEVYKVSDTSFYGWYEKGQSHIAYLNRSGEVIENYALPTIDDVFFIASMTATDSLPPRIYVEGVEFDDQFKLLYLLQPGKAPQIVDSLAAARIRGYLGQGDFIYKLVGEELWVYDLNLQLKYQLQVPLSTELLFADREKGLWGATGRGKLSRFYPVKSYFKRHNYAQKNMAWHTAVRGITSGTEGDLWLAQGGFLAHISASGKRSYLTTPGADKTLPDFFGILLQRDGKSIWIANGNTIGNIDPQRATYRFSITKEEVSLFWQPYEDKNGRILLGSSEGLFTINNRDSTIQPIENEATFKALSDASIFAFHENKKGLWLCTSKGLFLLNDKDALMGHYHNQAEEAHYLPQNIISHLHEDKSGAFWLATKGGGLIYWHPETSQQEQFTTEDGLLDNTLYAVYADDFNQLWLPSNNGLMCFNKETKEVIYYSEPEGLPHLEFNTISHFQKEDGTLYFGGLNGAISFQPAAIMETRAQVPLLLTGFQKQNREDEIYLQGRQALIENPIIQLSPEDKMVQVSFALLDYYNSGGQRYAYQIEGYDKGWQSTETPVITINALPYGTYTLRFKAQAAGSPWQEYAQPITIEVLRPFYLQAWFIALVLLLIIAVVATIIRWRFSILRKRKEELEELVEERTAEIAQQAEELKSLDRLKSRFFANISHELRTPLTLILGHTEDLQDKPQGLLDEPTVRKRLAIMEQNGNNLLLLIEEILELSKLQANKVEVNESATLLKPFIGNIFSSFQSLANVNTIRYRLDYTVPKDCLLYLDRPKLEKILNNLLSNAFKFTPAGEEVCLEVEADATWLYFRVQDGGLGIHEKDIPHIFDRFYQAKYSKTTALGGTGIGLALCKEFTQLLGGTIEVQSDGQKGSTFLLKLPKKAAEAPSKEEPELESTRPLTKSTKADASWKGTTKKPTLLCVEDNIDMQGFLMDLLQDQYRILTANNGLEGLKILKENKQKIDLVISDAMMPLLDGFSMLERLKADEDLRHLPVIMLTARAAEEDKLRALTIGVDDYLLKPFSRKELLARIQNLLQNYEKRKLWKQDLLRAAKQVQQQVRQEEKELEVQVEEEEEQPEISQQDLLWMKEVETELKKHLADEEFTIETLARKMLLSKRQLERKIKKVTGLSPAKLVLEVRMQAARDYLEKGRYSSLSELSYAVGFKTSSYFSKRYYKRFGKKPTDYFS